MIVGFTGTREGCTPAQGGALARLVRDWEDMTEFHHGAAFGADTEAVTHVAYYQPGAAIHARPCDIKGASSYAALSASQVTHPARRPLDRNGDIVAACAALVVCPAGPEVMRSGTWATVRRARKARRRMVFVWPDGSVTTEGE